MRRKGPVYKLTLAVFLLLLFAFSFWQSSLHYQKIQDEADRKNAQHARTQTAQPSENNKQPGSQSP